VIPEQIGWPATIAALLGLVIACRSRNRSRCGPYLALLAATYLTFTPMAELEPRHAIYWVPGLAVLAAIGATRLSRLCKSSDSTSPGVAGWRGIALHWSIPALVVLGTFWQTARSPHLYVFGYEDAANYVLANSSDQRLCLMDGFLNGGFIYQMRRHDPEHRWAILRGDKLLYGMLSDPHAGYREWVTGEAELLEILYRYDPEWIIVEEPQIYFQLPGATLLRQALRDHPERFELRKVIDLRTNDARFQNRSLLIYKTLIRNPNRINKIEYEMLSLGKGLGR
jgi:hypothetical protein